MTHPAVQTLLREHLEHMRAISPPESVHALDLDDLRAPGVTFWSMWDDDVLVGCGALKELDATHGEVKSMRTSVTHRGRGVARAVLAHLVVEARSRGYRRLSLETGSTEAFHPARRLYVGAGFITCGPFGDYAEDPHSVFMTVAL